MKKLIYELTICSLAIVSVIFAITDMVHVLPDYLFIIDKIIYLIFVIDYISRLTLSKNKKSFMKQNILDLIAILPVGSAIRVFRAVKIFRFAKIAKLMKLTKLFTVSGRLIGKCKKFLDTNGFKYMLIISFVFILIGGSLISYFEGMTLVDGIWWAFVTATTVGYGDISPNTGIGRIIACILMITGIGLIGSLTSSITTYFMSGNNNTASNGRVDFVIKMYNELNEQEKEEFKNNLK